MKTILFADDNKNIREYCRRELEYEGYRVLLAGDGTEVLAAMRDERPDLVILDVCMPRMNGLETLEAIRSICPGIPIVFFTSFDDECARDRRGCLATACVEKCADLTELKRVIVKAMHSQANRKTYRVGLPPGADCGPHRPAHQPVNL
jgi:CheY-like chemotaxis protein